MKPTHSNNCGISMNPASKNESNFLLTIFSRKVSPTSAPKLVQSEAKTLHLMSSNWARFLRMFIGTYLNGILLKSMLDLASGKSRRFIQGTFEHWQKRMLEN